MPVAPAKHSRDTERLRAIGAALPNAFILGMPTEAQRWRDRAEHEHVVLDIAALGDDAPLPAHAVRFEGAPGADEVALLLPTSGSSGTPKLVALTHREVIRRTVSCVLASGLGREHVALN